MATCSALPAPSRRPRACSRWTAACGLRPSTWTTRTQNATSTTCRTRRAKRKSTSPSRTRSGLADTTQPSSSRKARRATITLTKEEGLPMASQLNFKDLQDLAAEILGIDPDQVQMDKSFQRDLAADSPDLVELIAAIEDKYDVELPDEELEKMKVIADLWKFLEQKTAERLEA